MTGLFLLRNFLGRFLKSYDLELRQSDGLTKSKRLSLRRGLRLSGFFEDMASQSSSRESVSDFSDSSISVSPESKSTLMSFPSSTDVVLNQSPVFIAPKDIPTYRVTISQPEVAHQLEFAFPNGSRLMVSIQDPTKEDIFRTLKTSIPLGWVGLGHIAILALMMLSFMIPKPTLDKDIISDVSKMQTSVVYSSTMQPVGKADDNGSPVTKEMLAMQKALKNFGIKKTQPSLIGKKYSGFQNELSKNSAATSVQPLIGFAGPGGIDGPPLNISESEISRVLAAVNQQLKECYDDALIQDSNLQGRPQVVISVAKVGKVEDVALNYVRGSTKSMATLKGCFRSTLARLKFPEANQAFAVTQTLVLTR